MNAIIASFIENLESNWTTISLILIALTYFYFAQKGVRTEIENLKEKISEIKDEQRKQYDDIKQRVNTLDERIYSQLREESSLDREWRESGRGGEESS